MRKKRLIVAAAALGSAVAAAGAYAAGGPTMMGPAARCGRPRRCGRWIALLAVGDAPAIEAVRAPCFPVGRSTRRADPARAGGAAPRRARPLERRHPAEFVVSEHTAKTQVASILQKLDLRNRRRARVRDRPRATGRSGVAQATRAAAAARR
jgi:hypothetical protein